MTSEAPRSSPIERVLSALFASGVSDFLDESGRPLGEHASLEYTQQNVVVDEPGCPFSDARADTGMSINRAALRQVRRFWPEILESVDALIAHIVPPGQENGLSFYQAWCLHTRATVLPVYLQLRDSAHPPLPEAVAALYKVSLGFSLLFPSLLLEHGAAVRLSSVFPDAEAFFRLLDDEGWLIGSQQVCAGSKSAIGASYERMLSSPRGPVQVLHPALLTPALESFETHYRELFALLTLGCARAMVFVRQGQLEEAPGYGGRPDRIDHSAWPCMLRLAGSELRPAAIVASQRALEPQSIARLYPGQNVPESLRRLMHAPCATLSQLDDCVIDASREPIACMMAALGHTATEVPPLCRDDFVALAG